jgi:hypothetical protein
MLNPLILNYYNGKKIDLTVDKNYVYIIADEQFIKSSESTQMFRKLNIEQTNGGHIQNMTKLKFSVMP